MVSRLTGREGSYDEVSLMRYGGIFDESKRPEGLAIVPGFARGACQPLLLVVIGLFDDCETRLLQTVEYLNASCRNTTRFVVFHAISWSGMAWADHRDSFRASKAVSILKLLGSEPMILNPMY